MREELGHYIGGMPRNTKARTSARDVHGNILMICQGSMAKSIRMVWYGKECLTRRRASMVPDAPRTFRMAPPQTEAADLAGSSVELSSKLPVLAPWTNVLRSQSEWRERVRGHGWNPGEPSFNWASTSLQSARRKIAEEKGVGPSQLSNSQGKPLARVSLAGGNSRFCLSGTLYQAPVTHWNLQVLVPRALLPYLTYLAGGLEYSVQEIPFCQGRSADLLCECALVGEDAYKPGYSCFPQLSSDATQKAGRVMMPIRRYLQLVRSLW